MRHSQGLTFTLLALAAASAMAQTAPALVLEPCTGKVVYTVTAETNAATDAKNIQRAIDLASTTGGTVIFGDGTYLINPADTIGLKPNVTLCSKTGQAVLKLNSADSGYLLNPFNERRIETVKINNINIYNLVFDNGVVIASGDNYKIRSNTFRNIKRILAGDAFWSGLGFLDTSNSVASGNVFQYIGHMAIYAEGIDHVSIANNYFSNVYQPIKVAAKARAEAISITGNIASGITYMGIEVQSSSFLPGIVVSNNVLTNWKDIDQGANFPFGLSIVTGDSATVKDNTVVCGAGCRGSKLGLGIEIAGRGKTVVSNNTVSDFHIGIQVNDNANIKVLANAIYKSEIGIYKTQGEATVSLLIDSNQIENPRLFGIGAPNWERIAAPVISNNLITRTPGSWPSDTTVGSPATFYGMYAGPSAPGTTPMQIKGNRFTFEGAPVANLAMFGIFIPGGTGIFTGMTIADNWFGSLATTPYGTATVLNSPGANIGVNLTNNVFQNLSTVNLGGPDTNYVASGNRSVNMQATALWPNQQVAIPSVKINPVSTTVTTSPNKSILFTPSGYGTFASPIWASGDGYLSTAVWATRTYNHPSTFDPPVTLNPRLIVSHPSGAISIGKASVILN
jgi:hypothetical protein